MGWDGPCSGDTLPLSSSFSSFSPIFPEGPERYMEEEEEEDRGSRKREGGRTDDDDDDGPITYQVEGQPAPPLPPPGLSPLLPFLPLLLINAGRNIISFVAAGWGRKKVLPATSLSFSTPPPSPLPKLRMMSRPLSSTCWEGNRGWRRDPREKAEFQIGSYFLPFANRMLFSSLESSKFPLQGP